MIFCDYKIVIQTTQIKIKKSETDKMQRGVFK